MNQKIKQGCGNMVFRKTVSVLVILLIPSLSCESSTSGDNDASPDADSDSDSDGDSDSDTDTEPITEIEWVTIEGGSFMMGSEEWGWTQPVHNVDVPTFEMAKTEVTIAHYQVCIDDGVCVETVEIRGAIAARCRSGGLEGVVVESLLVPKLRG